MKLVAGRWLYFVRHLDCTIATPAHFNVDVLGLLLNESERLHFSCLGPHENKRCWFKFYFRDGGVFEDLFRVNDVEGLVVETYKEAVGEANHDVVVVEGAVVEAGDVRVLASGEETDLLDFLRIQVIKHDEVASFDLLVFLICQFYESCK